MSFFSSFSSKKKNEKGSEPIPQDILSSVKVMSDEKKDSPQASKPVSAPTNLPIASAASSPSPFLQASSASVQLAGGTQPTGPRASVPSRPATPEKKQPVPPLAPLKTLPKKPAPGNKLTIVLIIGIILLILAGGGYYYWQSEKAKNEAGNQGNENPLPLENTALPTVNQSGNPEEIPGIKTLPYALDKPNYLSLDTETAEITGVRKNIDEVISRLIEGKVAEPIEFIITDKNNNPLAFSRFVYLLGLTLPQDLLGETEEVFSLYLSAESGRAVVGLRLSLKDPARGSALVTQNEGKLPKQLSPLLYAGTTITIPADVTFKPSPSRAEVRIVRYHNFSLDPNISFDYTLSGKEWFIGTSKEMFRRMLEKGG